MNGDENDTTIRANYIFIKKRTYELGSLFIYIIYRTSLSCATNISAFMKYIFVLSNALELAKYAN